MPLHVSDDPGTEQFMVTMMEVVRGEQPKGELGLPTLKQRTRRIKAAMQACSIDRDGVSLDFKIENTRVQVPEDPGGVATITMFDFMSTDKVVS